MPNKAAITGDAITPKSVTISKIVPNVPAAWATNILTFSSPCCCLISLNTGTNACAKAPSANKRRKKLGIRFANKNTSAAAPAPNKLATTASRTSPKIREIIVIALTIIPERNKPFDTINPY